MEQPVLLNYVNVLADAEHFAENFYRLFKFKVIFLLRQPKKIIKNYNYTEFHSFIVAKVTWECLNLSWIVA